MAHIFTFTLLEIYVAFNFDFQPETYLKHIKETLNAPTGSKFCSEMFNSLYKFTIIGKCCVIFIT